MTDVLSKPVLVLNRHFSPIQVTTAKRAFVLLYGGVATALDDAGEEYDFDTWRELPVREDDDGVTIRVADRGAGIADAGKLFRPFYTTKSDGMGLGLAICRTVVESHGGRLWADANPGGGARLTFRLPRSTPPARIQAIDDMLKQDKAYDVVRQRIADEGKDAGPPPAADAGKKK